ncbi:hypothetical protein D3C86_1966960 [compost metagenome]
MAHEHCRRIRRLAESTSAGRFKFSEGVLISQMRQAAAPGDLAVKSLAIRGVEALSVAGCRRSACMWMHATFIVDAVISLGRVNVVS